MLSYRGHGTNLTLFLNMRSIVRVTGCIDCRVDLISHGMELS